MSFAKSLRVTDPRGVQIASWKVGDVFTAPRGSRIAINASGIATFNGKVLNLPSSVREALVARQRVVVEG
jgi:hypothetical protein